MRIELNKLPSEGMTVCLTGGEDWLDDIYSNFLRLGDADPSQNQLLSGKIQIVRSAYDHFALSGTIQYQPYLSCDRCDHPIQVDLSCDPSVTIRPLLRVNADKGGEFELTREDLEYYFVEEDGVLDLFTILNDIIQLNVPSQVTPESSLVVGAHHCAERVTAKIAIEEQGERLSPFGVLASLKDRLSD